MEHPSFVSVLLDQAVDKPLDYEIPEKWRGKLTPGMRLLVPVRGKLQKSTLLELKHSSSYPKTQLVADVCSDTSLLSPDLFTLARWMSKYYATPLRKVLKLFLPPSIRNGMKEKTQLFITSALSLPDLATYCAQLRQKRKKGALVLDTLLQNPKGMLLSHLLEKTGASPSVISTLVKDNILSQKVVTIDRSLLLEQEFFLTKPKLLSSEQQEALQKIQRSLTSHTFETHLLFGVTGSGKTEVYLQAIETALSQGKTALFLVPEISLTSQTIERLKTRFEKRVALLHSQISPGEKRDAWYKIQKGEVSVVVGARSSVFSPLPHLGLLIVDEEHDSSYKQGDEMPTYHARDVAVMRGKLLNATVVLGTATPSLESYYNTLENKYTLSCLRNRAKGALLPQITVVDMKKEYDKAKKATLFSDKLLEEVEKRYKKGEQALLFLNRRGFHTTQVCSFCGHKTECPHCSLPLTFHKGEAKLSCHLCSYCLSPPPKTCPSCHKEEGLKFKGFGTEQVEKALHAIFPDIRTLRLDADTTRHKGSHEKLFKQFRSGKADVLIGTQMIAKGLHFPSVTLVGILQADAALQIPDFRSSETIFQLITQVAGRAGRADLEGAVIIQALEPTHPTIQHAAKGDFLSFFTEELESRKFSLFPPFCHLVKLVFSGPSEEKTIRYAESIRTYLLENLGPSYTIYPIIPCGYAKIKDQFRFQLLIKGDKIRPIGALLEQLPPPPSSLKKLVDVDPLSTFF